jgi:hypothetical protein
VDEHLGVALPRRRAERLAGLAADDDDRRPGLLGDARALRAGSRTKTNVPAGASISSPFDRERRVPFDTK